MATHEDILAFARKGDSFTIRDLQNYFQSSNVDFRKRSVETQIGRMVKSNVLERIGRGRYVISPNHKSGFIPFFNDEMEKVSNAVRESYPFLNICVWNLDDIKRLSHYASKRDVIYVEVDREATEGVYNLLTNKFPESKIFINPTENEYTYYINGEPAIVVKPLRTEAPCFSDKYGILHPSIEKTMVDVISDTDFTPWQNHEAVRLYETIYEIYEVSITKLMRYALRRSKSERVKKILSEINK